MLATVMEILAVGAKVIEGAKALAELGKDTAPSFVLLGQLFNGKKVTKAELEELRARNDALNDEIENQTESGT